MTELEKIEYAKSFIDKLANGINPIDDSLIPDDDVVNNVRLSRCFFYVSDILRQVIENGGISPAPQVQVVEKKSKKQPYYLLPEQAELFEYSNVPITATEIFNRIMAVGPQEGVKKLPKRNLTKWLLSLGLIEEVVVNETRIKRPTESGREIGISLEERWGQRGSYYVVLYNRDAQQFIIDNIEAMLSFEETEHKPPIGLENRGKPWNSEQDEKLVALFKEGLSIREIAGIFKRGEKAIRIRLRKNGIDPDETVEGASSLADSNMPEHQTKSVANDTSKPKITCQSCKFARSGECFPQKEICTDYERAYDVPKDEREAWPDMGDASYLRQKGRRRDK